MTGPGHHRSLRRMTAGAGRVRYASRPQGA